MSTYCGPGTVLKCYTDPKTEDKALPLADHNTQDRRGGRPVIRRCGEGYDDAWVIRTSAWGAQKARNKLALEVQAGPLVC